MVAISAFEHLHGIARHYQVKPFDDFAPGLTGFRTLPRAKPVDASFLRRLISST
jgi:hypothetical protein